MWSKIIRKRLRKCRHEEFKLFPWQVLLLTVNQFTNMDIKFLPMRSDSLLTYHKLFNANTLSQLTYNQSCMQNHNECYELVTVHPTGDMTIHHLNIMLEQFSCERFLMDKFILLFKDKITFSSIKVDNFYPWEKMIPSYFQINGTLCISDVPNY